MTEGRPSPASALEQRVLVLSTTLTVAFAVGGILLGWVTNSMAILFDGVFSFVEVGMALIALFASRLVLRENDRRFQYGYWHLEPMALAFNGGMLVLLCLYAFVSAVGSLLRGGEQVALGWALGWAAFSAVVCFAFYAYERVRGARLGSAFITLDRQGWLMAALSSTALVVAFGVAWVLEQGPYAHLAPYIDPATLAVLSLAFIPVPVRILREAVSEVLLMTPAELDAEVQSAVRAVIERNGFGGFTSYTAKVGRGRFIEVHVIVDPTRELGTVASLDALRHEIADALDAHWPDAWLTVDFTADEEWI